jgi:hypothetical protein
MSAMLKNRFVQKLLLLITLILSAFLYCPSTGYCFTQADVDAFVNSYFVFPHCHIRVEGYQQPSSCQSPANGSPPEQWQGKKIIQTCSIKTVKSVSVLVNISAPTHVSCVDCGGMSGFYDCTGYDYVYADVQQTNTLCNGESSIYFYPRGSFPLGYLEYNPSDIWSGGVCNYFNFYYYPHTTDWTVYPWNVNCAPDETVIADFFPICASEDCCGVCGCCAPVH